MPRKNAPTPRMTRPFIGRLDTLKSCRQELARLYRSARASTGGVVTMDSAYKGALIVGIAAKLITESELEARIAEIEKRLEPATGPQLVRGTGTDR